MMIIFQSDHQNPLKKTNTKNDHHLPALAVTGFSRSDHVSPDVKDSTGCVFLRMIWTIVLASPLTTVIRYIASDSQHWFHACLYRPDKF